MLGLPPLYGTGASFSIVGGMSWSALLLLFSAVKIGKARFAENRSDAGHGGNAGLTSDIVFASCGDLLGSRVTVSDFEASEDIAR